MEEFFRIFKLESFLKNGNFLKYRCNNSIFTFYYPMFFKVASKEHGSSSANGKSKYIFKLLDDNKIFLMYHKYQYKQLLKHMFMYIKINNNGDFQIIPITSHDVPIKAINLLGGFTITDLIKIGILEFPGTLYTDFDALTIPTDNFNK